jgi:hypothetical protein
MKSSVVLIDRIGTADRLRYSDSQVWKRRRRGPRFDHAPADAAYVSMPLCPPQQLYDHRLQCHFGVVDAIGGRTPEDLSNITPAGRIYIAHAHEQAGTLGAFVCIGRGVHTINLHPVHCILHSFAHSQPLTRTTPPSACASRSRRQQAKCRHHRGPTRDDEAQRLSMLRHGQSDPRPRIRNTRKTLRSTQTQINLYGAERHRPSHRAQNSD